MIVCSRSHDQVFLRLGKTCHVPRLHHEPFYKGLPCQFASVNVAGVAYHLYPTPFLVFYATPEYYPVLGNATMSGPPGLPYIWGKQGETKLNMGKQ